MYKFRTMHVHQDGYASAIAAKNDPRVFVFGQWLRRLKIDELPQLINVLKGEMAIVGPRPEDPRIVDEFYSKEHLETLTVLPGLASPGSIYNYTHGERLLGAENTERQYVEQVMPVKLALDIVYVREASVVYDLKIILRTVRVILAIAFGKRDFADPPEMIKAARQQSRVATKPA
jgi:lipopolysaccharide/colanic/teichoic acid biosynthesis glycosyltransferase